MFCEKKSGELKSRTHITESLSLGILGGRCNILIGGLNSFCKGANEVLHRCTLVEWTAWPPEHGSSSNAFSTSLGKSQTLYWWQQKANLTLRDNYPNSYRWMIGLTGMEEVYLCRWENQ